jgi:beta-glucanase (GH16 family)
MLLKTVRARTLACLGAAAVAGASFAIASAASAALNRSSTPLSTHTSLVPTTSTPAARPSTAKASSAKPRVTSRTTFQDDFTGVAGKQPSDYWSFQTGGNGWGNKELESYTSRPSNASLDGKGHLAITAIRERYTGTDGITRNYTSARVYSKAPINFGYVEARILVPAGKGLWPAFWTMGSNVYQVGWPLCGEIDILESYGPMTSLYATVHAANTSARTAYAHATKTPQATSLAGTWHTFGISHTSSSITWYIDGVAYHTLEKKNLRPGEAWPYDQAQYLLLNLAVGGTGPGSPDATTPARSTMLVDWVRGGDGIPPDAH